MRFGEAYFWWFNGITICLYGLSLPYQPTLDIPILYFAIGYIFSIFMKEFDNRHERIMKIRKMHQKVKKNE